MRLRNGAGAGSLERDARLLIVLVGDRDNQTVKPTSLKKQFKSPRAARFARALARVCGPKLAGQSWQRVATTEAAR